MFGNDLAVGGVKLGVGFLRHGSTASTGWTGVLRVPADGIATVMIGEFQFHEGGGFRGSVFGAEHSALPEGTAGFAVKGEGDGVKNGGFAGAGVAGNEVKAAGTQLFQVQHLESCVGTEGGNGQFQRSHASSLQMVSIKDWI